MDEIIEKINKMIGTYSGYQIFYDWVKMMALTFSNSSDNVANEQTKRREQEFLELTYKHKDKMKNFTELTGMLALLFENEIDDYLGKIFMQGGLNGNQTGQFFTPFHISEMLGKIQEFPSDGDIYMNEPSCGSGGLIIATAKAMKEKGSNYQSRLKVVAQDLDWMCVYMAYVQLSLLGINAKVIQGSSIYDEEKNILYTPKYKSKV